LCVCRCGEKDSSDVQSSLMCDTHENLEWICTSIQFLYCGYFCIWNVLFNH